MRNDLPEIRCGHCGKLLARGLAVDLEIRCPRCGADNHVRAASPDHERRECRKQGHACETSL
ncbi:Com family DNA-binding transcriptional regulator [Bilophila wadsworthia]|uniref:Com family DNA-binding transcriptional regulator n=1 Tax=Bilophila wadsworthia TaxID=35833 RepID=UPI001D0ABC4C|nr:Com family DNA-binding transcriptional regulator [Bilophila wadsworthia]MCB8572108.1 Com family DNA-binding transcriptional regulator [Bilophila wadsworthia]